MTSTQAPTPGPLSVGQEETVAFNLCAVHGFDPDFVKTQRDFALAVIREYEVVCRPRLAPTAPVEASGSEREAVARVEAFLGSVRGLIRQEGRTLDPADLRAILAALSTTPARAEAQDEGAALSDEDHAVIRRCVERQPKLYVRGQHEGYYIHSDIAALIDMIGRAHPSPPPAADADRVRIDHLSVAEQIMATLQEEVSALDAYDEDEISSLEANVAGIILAALKSTAAKEGGE